MNPWRIGGALLCVTLAAGRPCVAQTLGSPRVFVDGAMMSDRDPTEFFRGSDTGTAARGAIGVHLSEYNSLRFEIDVPRWRATDTASSGPVWCAESAGCLGGVGFVPARSTSHTAVRTVSHTLLYARHLPSIGRAQVALVAGGSIEQRASRSSGSFDELDQDGRVVRHRTHEDERVKYWPAAVFGVDVEVRLTSHLAVTPQFRFQTFPYPAVSIGRPGIALRWRF